MNDQATEQQIQEKGLTAPRVTPEDIEANIASEHYFTALDGVLGNKGNGTYAGDHEVPKSIESLRLLTFCVLVLRNGFTVTGGSSFESPENFDAENARNIARRNAVKQIYPLIGFELKQRLHTESTAPGIRGGCVSPV